MTRSPKKPLSIMTGKDVESQVSGFLRKYTPEIEEQLREARIRLRAMFPRGYELVFDNYNALVFGFSPSERSTDAFLSVVGYPRWITLFFLHGKDLQDPDGLLEGRGKQVRSIRLKHPADINSAPVAALIAQAVLPHAATLSAAPVLKTIIKMALSRQRPRRPSEAKSKRSSSSSLKTSPRS